MAEGIGSFVLRRRTDLNLTQAKLAGLIGVNDRTYVTALEKGRIRLPELPIRQKLAKALRVREVELLVAAGEIDPSEVTDIVEVPLRLKPFLPQIDQLNNENFEIVLVFADLLLKRQHDRAVES